jgi:hypothetical protein
LNLEFDLIAHLLLDDLPLGISSIAQILPPSNIFGERAHFSPGAKIGSFQPMRYTSAQSLNPWVLKCASAVLAALKLPFSMLLSLPTILAPKLKGTPANPVVIL